MRPVSRVTLYVDDENVITAGDDTGLEISAECPNATQAIADMLLARFKGFQYQAMSANDANIDPAAELGDSVTADGMYSVIARISDDGSGYVSVSAPGEEELEDEYPMDGPLTRAITQATDRKIADTRSSITKTAEEIRLEVSQTYATNTALGETESRLNSSITQTADSIKSEVKATYSTKDELGTAQETLSSEIEQTAKSIKLSVTGSLGGNASITLSGGGGGGGTVDLSEVRSAFANDETAITISAGKVSFKSNTFTVDSTYFDVAEDGTITAKAGKIGNWNIGTALYSGTNSMSSTAVGTYLGTDGIRNYASGSKYVNITGGVLTAKGANIEGAVTATSGSFTGSITANTGSFGGWNIETSGIKYVTSDKSHEIVVRPQQSDTKLGVIYVGESTNGGQSYNYPFRLNGDGSLVATKATITGAVTATSGKIGNWTIDKALYSGTNSMSSTTAGTYLGTDGIRNYASGSKYVNITGGVLTAKGANIEGEITATSGSFKGSITASDGELGGWKIEAGGISYESSDGLNEVRIRHTNNTSKHNSVFHIATRSSKTGSWEKYPFRVNGDGTCSATNFTISGESVANGITFSGTNTNSGTISGGTISKPTISGSTLSGTTTNTGATISGGTYSSGTVSYGTISHGTLSSSTGGTYVGTCSGSTLSSCTTGGTSLSVAAGGTIGRQSDYTLVSNNNGVIISDGTGSYGQFFGVGHITGSLQVSGSITCNGTKPRTMTTVHYGKRQLDAFETPLPTFSDYGTAALDETGVSHIIIDPVFAETVNDTYLPTVFLTKYGEGDIWVERVEHDVVTVRGTPGLEFAWETRYAQANAGVERLRVMDFDYQDVSTNRDFEGDAAIAYEHSKSNIDYAQMGYEYYTDFERSLSA